MDAKQNQNIFLIYNYWHFFAAGSFRFVWVEGGLIPPTNVLN